uniref:Acyl-CoA synthetase long chain family member 1 n=1 Tax=Aotus nancymaae TaxID=37293 RepID=A0A2K5ETM4_AOTNA
MQAHELFRYSRMPELVDFQQYVRTLPTNTLMGFAAFAALTTFWYATRPKALKPPCDLSMQLVEVAGSGDARRSTLLDSDEPLVYFYKDVTTLYEGFQREIHVSNNGPCLVHCRVLPDRAWTLDRRSCWGPDALQFDKTC